jgi:hypothetical protein
VSRTVHGLGGRELVEVLFDPPARAQATEIFAFRPNELRLVRRERRRRR